MDVEARPQEVAEGPVEVPPQRSALDKRRLAKRILGYSLLTLFGLMFLMPFVLAIVTAFKTRPDIAANPVSLIPAQVTLDGFAALDSPQIRLPRWALNSVIVSVSVTLGRLFLNSLAGYALARMEWPGRGFVFGIVVAVLAVPPIVLAIPRFIVLGQLGMLNSYAGLILPLAVDAFGIFLMKQFFESIPKEMEEAAFVDGASIFQTYWRVVLPLAAPGLIALTILSFQGSWNEFLHPLIAAPGDPSLRTLPVGLALLAGQFGEGAPLNAMMAASLLTIIPVAIVFAVFQRYFVQGVAAAGVKG